MGVASAKVDFSDMPIRTYFSGTMHDLWPWCLAIEAAGKKTVGDLMDMTESDAFSVQYVRPQDKAGTRRLLSDAGKAELKKLFSVNDMRFKPEVK